MKSHAINGQTPLLEVHNLVKHFPVRRGVGDILTRRPAPVVRAVDGVSFQVARGRTLALVGESGCGKTTTGRCVLYLQAPTSGEVFIDGKRIDPSDDGAMRERRKQMQIVFQDPNSSLNPRMTIGQTLGEVLTFHNMVPTSGKDHAVNELLETVGLSARQAGPRDRLSRSQAGAALSLRCAERVVLPVFSGGWRTGRAPAGDASGG